MNIKNFRQYFNPTIYSRGNDYYRFNNVRSVNVTDDTYTAEVLDSGTYYTEIEIDDDGDILGMKCTCPYGAHCKHEAATLIYIREKLWSGRRKEEGSRSSEAVKQLISAFSEKSRKTAMTEISEPVRLIPLLTCMHGILYLEVKIGRSRLYSVSNINRLCSDFEYGYEKKYGKELTFDHDPAALDEKSRAFLDFLMYYCNTNYASSREIRLDHEWARVVFEIFIGGTISLNDKECNVIDSDPDIRLRIKEAENGYKLNLVTAADCRSIGKGILYFPKTNDIYYCSREYMECVFPVLNGLYKEQNSMFIHKKDIQAFCSAVLTPVSEKVEIIGAELLEDYTPPQLQAKLSLDCPDGTSVFGNLEFIYDEKTFPAFGSKTINPFCNYIKEAEAEAVTLKYFAKECPDDRYNLSAMGDENVYRLLTEGMTELSEKMDIYATDSLRHMTVRPPAAISVGIRPKSSLLELDINTEDYTLAELAEMLSSYRKGRKFHRMKDGSFAQLSEQSMEEMSQLLSALNISDRSLLKGKLTVPQYRMFYLDSLQSSNEGLRVHRSAEFKKAAEKYGTVSERVSEMKPPEELDGVMRGYQKYGFLWLKTIKEYGFGGILADDMGLGKTLQAIALILDEKKNNPDFRTCLVVCPSSLSLNWISEIEKFAPSLKAAAAVGTAAERTEIIQKSADYDVIITSYASLMRDIEQYEDITFGFQFIDEAQYIKNHTTQSAKAVKAVKSGTRFALTGTPVENSLAELWSIFDFIMPDYLFGYTHFKSKFETPIVKSSSEKAASLLGKMTAPFILRRLKKEVLKELPEKTETTLAADMTEEQKKLYAANLLSLKNELISVTDINDGSSRFQILAMLTRLRQICCDPSLIYENYLGGSAKLEQCMELIEACTSAGHKVLLFSQFTSMLDIIAARFEAVGTKYFMLTGKTKPKERLKLVNRFNTDNTQVFLISLKAGGTGLNLTGADIVIHYDPWWNVSAENQASDRVYRIGQKNNVQIYKLIARGSIEEKIQELQKAKAELAELVLNPDADITRMSADDIMKLLE